MSLFEDISWPITEVNRKKWTEKQIERYTRLRRDTEDILDLVLKDSQKELSKAKLDDFALFNFLWYPETEDYESLWTQCLLTIWLFVWDDAIDSNDNSLSQNSDIGSAFRAETISRAKGLFGLAELDPDFVPSGAMIVLAEFAKRTRERFNSFQLENMFYELSRFVDGVGREQANRLSGHLPKSLDEYFATREFSSAVYPCLLSLELSSALPPLPRHVMHSPEMKNIFLAANHIIALHNDITSLKKEIANTCVINSVPVVFFSGTTPWDQVLPLIDGEIRDCTRRIDENAAVLLDKLSDGTENKGVYDATVWFVDGVRLNCSGNFTYSLVTQRYACLMDNMNADGDLEIVI
ncbi:isoprenoid synthase domain-containing protein [Echria macrotheca]|uniref:Terpene synthase n=1 Tax=Echria macrotheca TaxID=438768 RepID=A0AAJ0B0R9_9PEZI|nr:isoprenoid synthase domain-containing protein [Echria macrotheca]